MTAAPSFNSDLRDFYATELARIANEFARTGDGGAVVSARTALVEQIVVRLWNEVICDQGEPRNFALAAIGGFGRRWLFPCSDIDLLFLHADKSSEDQFKERIRRFSRELWDVRMKVSPTTRTLAECDRLDSSNVEFTISLLDCRCLAGDGELFTRLHDGVLPKLVLRESQTLVQRLAEITRARHGKFGNTVFHLEPNVKETPGGLRDYNVACWLALISEIAKSHTWPNPSALLPAPFEKPFAAASSFLMSLRCFLHFRHGRDDNTLTWEAQDAAAARNIGSPSTSPLSPEDWMRIFFRHARSIHRTSTRLLEEIPAARSSLYRQFQNWRSRVSNSDFSVVDGFIFLKQPAALNAETLLRLFQFIARHGLKLSTTTEQRIEQVLPMVAAPACSTDCWRNFREILIQPHAAEALRAMHSLRVLAWLLPEFKPIDALVIRDYYHRFTVDEHSILAVENLHWLRQAQSGWDQRYAEVLSELEQPELLYLSLLLHDAGKGVPNTNHVQASLELTEQALARLQLGEREQEVVRFLVGSHLELSAGLRRDIFDPATARALAEKVGTPERLKMLCLMTYTDIKSVSPEALTPWKAENIWQLYIATTHQLNRTVDERLHTNGHDENLAQLRSLIGAKKAKAFLDGLPTRYVRTYPAEDVRQHVEMADQLAADSVQIRMKQGRHWYELTLVTKDRPFLFAAIAGTLAACGMNIVKADAFSNQAGVVVDTFYFTDRFRTLELNLPEWQRFQRSISAVLMGEADLERMLRERSRSEKNGSAKVKVDTAIEFDDACSSHSTLLQVIAQDRLGLLHQISSCLSRLQCNIEIALIDTQGQMAIDVFYLTSNGAKLSREHQKRLRRALLEELHR